MPKEVIVPKGGEGERMRERECVCVCVCVFVCVGDGGYHICFFRSLLVMLSLPMYSHSLCIFLFYFFLMDLSRNSFRVLLSDSIHRMCYHL